MLKRDMAPFVMRDAWQVPFLRRMVNDQFEKYFSGNGYYPNEGRYDTNIRLNLQVFQDASKRVSSMDYYKVHDMTMGHGKPVLKHADLSTRDISVFTKALAASTVSTADSELEDLLQKVNGNKLPDGWKISSIDKKNIAFLNASNIQFVIPRLRICKALDISHNYLEILSYHEFWEANQECLKLDDADPLIALFSFVDPSAYYEYELLRSKSNERIQQSEIKARYELIKEAAAEGNTREINKQLKQIPQDKMDKAALSGALCNAIRNQHEALAKLLIQHGADINGNVTVDGKNYGPLFLVMDNGWMPFLSYCLKCGFKPDACGTACQT